MTIRLDWGDRRTFDFMEALQEWRVKQRKIFEEFPLIHCIVNLYAPLKSLKLEVLN